MLNVGDYVLAHVVGFYNAAGQPVGILRARVERVEPCTVFVRTADLADAGTYLPLPHDKVRPLTEESGGLRHRDGLVALEGGL